MTTPSQTLFGRRPAARRTALLTALAAVGTLALLAVRPLAAQAGLSGRVVDADGSPVAGASVTVSELGRRVRTEPNGTFTVADVPAGTYSVVVRHAGFADALVRVEIPAAATVTITLRPAPVQVEDVVVTATGSPTEARDTPLPSTTLGPDQLRREHTVSLAHTLEGLPGVAAISTGGEVGKPVIRGLSGDRVQVLEDGLPLEYYSWSDEDGPSMDARLADRVEVIRGPASVLYGPDAMGGVVNVIPEPLPDAAGGSAFVHGGLDTYGATMNHEFGGILHMEGASGAFGWRATAIGRKSEALHTPAGELDNTGFSALNGELAGGVRGGWGSLNVRYTRYGGDFKLLEATDNPQGPLIGALRADVPARIAFADVPGEEEGGPERKLSDDRVMAHGRFPLAHGLQLETKAQFQRHWTAEYAPAGEAGAPPPAPGEAEMPEFELRLNTGTAEVMLHHGRSEGLGGTLGLSGMLQDNATGGDLPIVPGATISSGGVFGFEHYRTGRLNLFAGARVDARRMKVDPLAELNVAAQTRNYTALTGSIGAAVDLGSGLTLSGNAGRAWRSPNLFDLFAYGPRIGEARFEIGDSTLTTEKSFNLDAGLRWHYDLLTLEAHAYRTLVNDYIYVTPTGQTMDGLPVYAHGQADAVLWGGELGGQLDPVSFLTLRGTFDFVRGTNRETRTDLPQLPAPKGTAEAEIHSDSLAWARNAYVRVGGRFVAGKVRLAPFEEGTDGYALLDLGAGGSWELGAREVHLDVSVRNATNASYRDFLSRYKDFALEPGRNVVVRAGVGL